jgi:isoleucyl-tRNA synthetase
LPGEVGIVALELETTAELEAEGSARDVIRLVQIARRDAGLQVTDRIRLWIGVSGELVPVLEKWQDHIATQVLAAELEIVAYGAEDPETTAHDDWYTSVGELADGNAVVIRLQRAT